MFAYTVRCEFSDLEVLRQWCEWLTSTHLAEVLEAGAIRAELVVLDESPICEARYVFEDRKAFEVYERDHAPRLRADGLQRFPLERGLCYSRSTGIILSSRRSS